MHIKNIILRFNDIKILKKELRIEVDCLIENINYNVVECDNFFQDYDAKNKDNFNNG